MPRAQNAALHAILPASCRGKTSSQWMALVNRSWI